MLLHDSPVWSFLRGTVSVQGQAVVLASTTLRRQSCCRSEVLTSSRIADLVDTSSGEAHHGGFPGILPPLLGGPLSEDRGGVQSVRGPFVHNVSPAIKLPVRGSDVLSYCRLSRSCGYLFRGSHHGGLPGIDTSSGEAIMVASPVSSCGLLSRLTGTVGHTLFKRALVGAPWVCPLILNGPSGIVPRGPHMFQAKASVHLDVSESAPGD